MVKFELVEAVKTPLFCYRKSGHGTAVVICGLLGFGFSVINESYFNLTKLDLVRAGCSHPAPFYVIV